MTIKKFDWKKTCNKFLIALAEILVSGAICYTTDHIEFMGLVPIFEAIRNWIKHR